MIVQSNPDAVAARGRKRSAVVPRDRHNPGTGIAAAEEKVRTCDQAISAFGGTGETGRRRNARALHVAVVHTRREICFVTAATSFDGLEERLAKYVQEHGRYQLWPDDLRRLDALLAAGERRAAIWLYFDSTGTKWDDERLRLEVVDFAGEDDEGDR